MEGAVAKARLEARKYEPIAGRKESAAATVRKKRLLFISSCNCEAGKAAQQPIYRATA
jgi:hypothetical protein